MNNEFNLGKTTKNLVGVAFLYMMSPLLQISIIDTAADAILEDGTDSIRDYDGDYPRMIRSTIIASAVMSDGIQLSDPFNYWKAKFSSGLSDCVSIDDGRKYQGAVSWGVNDKAVCLSQLTGVAQSDLEPKPTDGYSYTRFIERKSPQ